jgi:hypothetical protein
MTILIRGMVVHGVEVENEMFLGRLQMPQELSLLLLNRVLAISIHNQ